MTDKRIPTDPEPDQDRSGQPAASPPQPHDGSVLTRDGWECWFVQPITPEDWAALNEKSDIPPTIGYVIGMIRDDAAWSDIIGGVEVR